ncbi:RNA cap guanine-N2 methyltransferase-domain-containing protein [Delphinella strobiligena]|nr:RNA cap guanine-N2 methyltransferase-domain-containing protein [Delphinella strobiligena]
MATGQVQPDALQLPQHYDESSDMPEEIQKYWHQRYDIWSRYDDGILMTNDVWFGVTPEPVADKIAEHISQGAPASKSIIIDAFGGAGGNAIAFALSGRWQRIFAIEKDPNVLACGKHNAEVYGVASKIFWIQGDCLEVIKKRLKSVAKDAVIFASPPWGGPTYTGDNVFDLSTMQPYSLKDLYDPFSTYTSDFVLYLPRSSDLNQVAKYAPKEPGKRLEVTHYCMSGWSKAICVFFGDWNFD